VPEVKSKRLPLAARRTENTVLARDRNAADGQLIPLDRLEDLAPEEDVPEQPANTQTLLNPARIFHSRKLVAPEKVRIRFEIVLVGFQNVRQPAAGELGDQPLSGALGAA